MALTQQQLLYQMAEEAAWSFKGHMKTADGYDFTLICFIIVPLATSLLILIFDLPAFIQRIASATGFLFSALALNSTLATNKEKSNQTIRAHMKLGNEYLGVYNEIKVLATNIKAVDQGALSDFQKRIETLNNQTSNLRITLIGRRWSRWRINKEMDLSWIESLTAK